MATEEKPASYTHTLTSTKTTTCSDSPNANTDSSTTTTATAITTVTWPAGWVVGTWQDHLQAQATVSGADSEVRVLC